MSSTTSPISFEPSIWFSMLRDLRYALVIRFLMCCWVILDDLGWFGTAFVLSEFCLDFFLLFLRAQRTSEFSGLHLGFAWEARQKTHSIKHIPIRFRSDGGLPFGNQRWQWKNHTISLGISQLATFDDNAGYTIGKIDSIFSFLNGQPLISAPQTK